MESQVGNAGIEGPYISSGFARERAELGLVGIRKHLDFETMASLKREMIPEKYLSHRHNGKTYHGPFALRSYTVRTGVKGAEGNPGPDEEIGSIGIQNDIRKACADIEISIGIIAHVLRIETDTEINAEIRINPVTSSHRRIGGEITETVFAGHIHGGDYRRSRDQGGDCQCND